MFLYILSFSINSSTWGTFETLKSTLKKNNEFEEKTSQSCKLPSKKKLLHRYLRNIKLMFTITFISVYWRVGGPRVVPMALLQWWALETDASNTRIGSPYLMLLRIHVASRQQCSPTINFLFMLIYCQKRVLERKSAYNTTRVKVWSENNVRFAKISGEKNRVHRKAPASCCDESGESGEFLQYFWFLAVNFCKICGLQRWNFYFYRLSGEKK